MGALGESASLGGEVLQPSAGVRVKAQDFLPLFYAKRQRHVRFQLEQRALYETTGR